MGFPSRRAITEATMFEISIECSILEAVCCFEAPAGDPGPLR